MILAGAIAAAAMLFLLFKFNLRRIVSFDIMLDIIITFFFIWIFAGTFAGMMAGLVAGCIISLFLLVARKFVPRDKLAFVKVQGFPWRKFAWVPAD